MLTVYYIDIFEQAPTLETPFCEFIFMAELYIFLLNRSHYVAYMTHL